MVGIMGEMSSGFLRCFKKENKYPAAEHNKSHIEYYQLGFFWFIHFTPVLLRIINRSSARHLEGCEVHQFGS